MIGVAHLLWLGGDSWSEAWRYGGRHARGQARGGPWTFSGQLGGDIVVQSYESVRRGQAFRLLITSDEGVAVHVEVASQGFRVARQGLNNLLEGWPGVCSGTPAPHHQRIPAKKIHHGKIVIHTHTHTHTHHRCWTHICSEQAALFGLSSRCCESSMFTRLRGSIPG